MFNIHNLYLKRVNLHQNDEGPINSEEEAVEIGDDVAGIFLIFGQTRQNAGHV